MKMKYKDYEYNLLHRYVMAYQDGSLEAGYEIVKLFKYTFLPKFTRLVTDGIFKIDDYSVREFVKKYVKSKYLKKHIHTYKYGQTVVEEMYRVVQKIQYIFEGVEREEINHIAEITLLEMAKRYRDRNGLHIFHVYVNKAFHHYFYPAINVLTKDPSANRGSVEYKDDVYIDVNSQFAYEIPEHKADVMYKLRKSKKRIIIDRDNPKCPYEDDFMDLNWDNGITSGYQFNNLTPFERRIIKKRYMHNLSDQKIADELGMCRQTIMRKRNLAITKIQENIRCGLDEEAIQTENYTL